MEKVLVAEDSIIVNQHICKTLEVAGYEVFSAFSGKDAVALATKHEPDLILMDIMMESKADGIEAAVEIKKTIDIPVIFLTALTDSGTLERVKHSQPYGYIVKPFNEVELLSNIQVAIYKSKAEREVKNNHDLFQASINSIQQAFFLLDNEDKVYYLNTRAESLIGKKITEVVGQKGDIVLPIYHKKTDELFDFERLKNVGSDELFEEELILKTKENELPIGDIVLKQVQVKEGHTSTLFLFKEISDRIKARDLEEELEKRRITSLIEGQEHERDRLAREIHDGIGQMLNLIKMKAESLGDEAVKQELMPLLNQTLDEVRNVSEDLHPSRLSDFTIEKNLEKLVNQFNSDGSIAFSFTSTDVPELDLTTKTHIYRIVQECISNVVKHSKAKECAIQLYGMDKAVQLTIEDDGVGYDSNAPSKAGSHHGMQNIDYRVNSMNGNFTIDSSSQNGTMILINIPV